MIYFTLEAATEEEIKKMEDSTRRDLNIIAYILKEKKVKLENKAQLQTAIRRHLRPAKALKDFSDKQIINATEKAKEKIGDEWTLETLIKYATK